MARDYSSRRNNPPPKNGKRKPATRRAPAAKSVRAKKKSGGGGAARRSAPGWVWFLCGVFIAVTVAAGFYIFARPVDSGNREQVSVNLPNGGPAADNHGNAASERASSKSAGNKSPHKAASQKPRFSFYKMLPNYKVEIPQNERPESGGPAAGAPHDSVPADTSPAPTATPPPPTSSARSASETNHDKPGSASYVIQAGAFSTHADADRRKAQLALLGVSARIVDIDLSSGKTVYRVQSDTIGSQHEADSLVQRLKKHNIEALMMRSDH